MLVGMHAASVAYGAPRSIEIYSPKNWSVDREFVIQVLAILGAGLTIGIARFGFHGMARHASAVGAGIYLLCLVVMLGDMSDTSAVLGHLLVALGAMGMAMILSHFASDSSRLMLRFLR